MTQKLKAVYATDKDSVTGLYYPKSEVDKVIARHKYKLYLAMSKCREAQSRWCYQAANTLPPGVTATLNGKPVMVEPRRLLIRSGRLLHASTLWKQRAEKFKSNSTAQHGKG